MLTGCRALEAMPDLTVIAIPLYVVTMAWEILLVWRRPCADERGYTVRDTAIAHHGTRLAGHRSRAGGGAAGLPAVLLAVRVLDAGAGLTSDSWMIRIATWIGLFVLVDFCYYWFHRVHHEVRLFLGRPCDPPLVAVLQPVDGVAAVVDPIDVVGVLHPGDACGFTRHSSPSPIR